MAYTKQSWNNDDPSTPLSESRLRHIEDGIEAGYARANPTGTQLSSTISDFTEAAQDAVAALLAAGTSVTLSYDDVANTLTINAAAGGLDAEAVRDAIGVAMVGVGNVSVAVNDAADTITISTTATVNATDAALRDRTTHTGLTPLTGIPAGSVVYSTSAVARPTDRADVMVLFSTASDPSAVALTNDKWLRIA